MENKNYKNVICETKDLKAFTKEIQDLIKSDSRALSHKKAFTKDNEKLVELIDYMLGKYEKEIDALMRQQDVDYDDFVEALG